MLKKNNFARLFFTLLLLSASVVYAQEGGAENETKSVTSENPAAQPGETETPNDSGIEAGDSGINPNDSGKGEAAPTIESLNALIKNITNQHLVDIRETNSITFLVLFSLLLIVIAALVVLILMAQKREKKLIEKLEKLIDKSQENTGKLFNELACNLSDAIRIIKDDIFKIQTSVDLSVKDTDNILLELNNVQKSLEHTGALLPPPSFSNPLDAFNNWASNPQAKLPAQFGYLKNEMKIRTAAALEESTNGSSKWITNREGAKKYLFPNPNEFDQYTDIRELYNMDLSRLQDKGQNKIKIIKPCEMLPNGFIQDKGELQLL